MVEFRWIKVFFCVILLLQFTVVIEQRSPSPSVIVAVEHEVTLPCENVTNDHRECDSTSWVFSRYPSKAAEDVVVRGKIVERAQNKSDRLSVTAKCSLVIKKAAAEHAGRYFCEQLSNRSGQKQIAATLDLSVIIITEHQVTDKVTLSCSVSTYRECGHTVKWLFKGRDVAHRDLTTSQSYCSANATFSASHFIYTSKNYELLTCNVTDTKSGEGQQFTFDPQSSGVKTGTKKRASENDNTTEKPEEISRLQNWWWLYTIVAVASAAVLITVVALIRWRRNKGSKTEVEENVADPEDGVSYASISHAKKSNSKARVRGGDDAVTYAAVKASSSSAGASADPRDLYATIN